MSIQTSEFLLLSAEKSETPGITFPSSAICCVNNVSLNCQHTKGASFQPPPPAGHRDKQRCCSFPLRDRGYMLHCLRANLKAPFSHGPLVFRSGVLSSSTARSPPYISSVFEKQSASNNSCPDLLRSLR